MLKVGGMGYWGRNIKSSQGPWFKEDKIDDDGLEKYYVFNAYGATQTILSNNIPMEDRNKLQSFYEGINRAKGLATFFALWGGFECAYRIPRIRGLAIGWRVLAGYLVYKGLNTAFNYYNSIKYGPIISAFLKKYYHFASKDAFDIQDRKREFFQIDTSQYMNYGFEDLHGYHVSHGPQPDGEVLNNTWLVELDKYLKGEENSVKEHAFWNDYDFKFKERRLPTLEEISELFTMPVVKDEEDLKLI